MRSTWERVNLSECSLEDQEEEKEISQHGSAEKGGQDQRPASPSDMTGRKLTQTNLT